VEENMKKMVYKDIIILDQEAFDKKGLKKEEILGTEVAVSNLTPEPSWTEDGDGIFKVNIKDETDVEFINRNWQFKVTMEGDDFKTRVELFDREFEADTRCSDFLSKMGTERHAVASLEYIEIDPEKDVKVNGWMVIEE
jgi:hypothetical protein